MSEVMKNIDKPTITVKVGDMSEAVVHVLDAVRKFDGPPMMRRGGDHLIYAFKLTGNELDKSNGTTRYANSTVIRMVRKDWFRLRMDRAAEFFQYKWNDKIKDFKEVPINAPKEIADLCLNSPEDWGKFPEYIGMLHAPTIDLETGRTIDLDGVDPETGLLGVYNPQDFKPVERFLTRDEARERLRRVEHELLRGMPFKPESSVSVALSGMMTGLTRPLMRAAPLHLIDAAAASSGKSKLATVISIIASGTSPAVMTWATKEEENEKRLHAAIISGDSVILMDNIDAKRGDVVSGNFLNVMLTEPMLRVRILGRTEEVRVRNSSLQLGTGNSIVVAGDTCRRAVLARLDAECSSPENREFDWDCVEVAHKKRPELVVALLEAIGAWFDNGSPDMGLVDVGSYEGGWKVIRNVLVWCGYADPADTMAFVKATDANRADMVDALAVWFEIFENKWVTSKEIEEFLKTACPIASDDTDRIDRIDAFQTQLFDGQTTAGWITKELKKTRAIAATPYRFEMEDGRTPKFRVHKDPEERS